MHALSGIAQSDVQSGGTVASVEPEDSVSHSILRGGFELFRSTVTEFARLAIETSTDLFEMDPLVSVEESYQFKSKRGEWVKGFDRALRELFDRRLAGERRKGRRRDAEEALDSLRLINDFDQQKQSALGDAAKRLSQAAKQELDALDCRVAILLDESVSRGVDNPFSPDYLLDAIGMTSRALHSNPRIWRPLMERVIGDFVQTINQTYVRLNRFLAERGVLPEIGAVLRARSDLRPIDDRQLLPLFCRLLNDVHPSMQAWHTLDLGGATTASYGLAPRAVNPYVVAAANAPRRSAIGAGGFPRLDAMLTSQTLSPVLEMLDCWQRADPMVEHLRSSAPAGIDAGVTPVNRIPWIHAAIASRVTEESGRSSMDVVGFLFDYIFRDPSLPPWFRMIFDKLQVPILKAALADPGFFADKTHPARRLIDELAGAAIGADDDDDYGKTLQDLATSIVESICAEFVIDATVFERECRTLNRFIDHWQKRTFLALQPRVEAGLAAEARDTDRSQVRVLIRDKLAGVDISFDIRAFIGTVWADYLTQQRQAEGAGGESFTAAIKVIDDLLWSVVAKERVGQKARLSKLIPPLVHSLRAGGAAVEVADEKMNRFLDTLYDLHIAAIRPAAAGSVGTLKGVDVSGPMLLADKSLGNLHDFVADIVLGTWLAFARNGTRVKARLSWISPLRATYIFTGRSGADVRVLTPEELAWKMSTGKATLILEPVPLFDRAMSAALEYLAEQKAKQEMGASQVTAARPLSA